MKEMVRIHGWDNCSYKKESDGSFFSEYSKVWFSDDKNYAIIEVWGSELYVAVTIDSEEENKLICTYADHYTDSGWGICIVYNRVSWFLQYGFAKLHYMDMDTGASGVRRLYFNRKLYLEKYAEENGKPMMRAGKVVTEDML